MTSWAYYYYEYINTVIYAVCMSFLFNFSVRSLDHSEKPSIDDEVPTDIPLQLTVNGEHLEEVDQFCYLGCMVNNNCDDSRGIRRRLAIASSAAVSLGKIWQDKSIGLRTKLKLLRTLVFPIATYGCEC